jgi:dTDP-4-amino-4,6-dideoxygalactose transaminase
MINVTKPFLPPVGEYEKYLEGIWDRVWLTNNGPLVNELEIKLKEYLGLDHLLFLTNGTIALQIAIKALGIRGEIITTPFSFVATTSSIVWEGCEPVFVDIDRHTLNIDPTLIEAAITERTSAILATHVFGNPCDIEAIEQIAKKHNLKVIYDGAHAFGTTYKGRSIFEFGDVCTSSFHATKLFHTIEGGAVVTKDASVLKQMSFLRNFGHNGPETFATVGINGKNSEFHAAMGLCNLKYIDEILAKRKLIWDTYTKRLSHANLGSILINKDAGFNYSYYPVIFESEEVVMKVIKELEGHKISPRRYFYPCLSTLNYVKPYSTPVSMDISKRVLCLPSFHDMSEEVIDMISRIVLRAKNN